MTRQRDEVIGEHRGGRSWLWTVGLCVIALMAGLTTRGGRVDAAVVTVLLGCLVLTAVSVAAWWVRWEATLNWEVRRANPPTPKMEPRYWPSNADKVRGQLSDQEKAMASALAEVQGIAARVAAEWGNGDSQ
jgi:hypothetical protein